MTELNFEFEVFKPIPAKKNVPHIIMSKNGTLIFSAKCRKDFSIPNGGFAEIAYNKENKVLRIKIAENGNCLLKNWRIFALGLYKYFNIESPGKYPFSQYDNEDKVYYVDLKDTSLLEIKQQT